MNLSFDDIHRHFDSGTYARGEEYARKGKVLGLRSEGGRLVAEVAGSGGAVYHQSIRLSEKRNGVRIDGDCSCPMSFNCKHVVAALLVATAVSEEAEPPRNKGKGLSAAAEFWLSKLGAVRLAEAPAKATGPEYGLSFLLVPDGRNRMLDLRPCKTRMRKDGRFVGVSVQDDPNKLLASMPAWLKDGDEELLRLLVAVRAGRHGDASPAGSIGATLLERLCGQGRLLFAPTTFSINTVPLLPVVAGSRRQATLGWLPTSRDEEKVELCWRFDDGEDIDYVLPTEPLRYLAIDMDGRLVLGELALPAQLSALAPDALVKTVAEAPELQVHERAAMATALARQGLDRVLPVPQVLQERVRRDILPVPTVLLDCEETWARGEWHWHDYAQMGFTYDGELVLDIHAPVLRRVTGDAVDIIERNAQAERAAFETLAALGFRAPPLDSPVADEPWILQLPTEADWLAFARRDVPRLRTAGWVFDMSDDYRYDVVDPQEWYAELEQSLEDAGHWFSLELGILVEGKRHSLLPLLVQMIRKKPQHFDAAALAAWDDKDDLIVDLPGGMRVALPAQRIKPILATLGELYFGEHLEGRLRLPELDAARLAELEQAAQMRWMGGERLRELGRKLHAFDGMRQVEAPAGLHAELRPYQRTGLSWMQFLREYGFGGILADDMGLGKTIQTLAHILAEKEAGRLDAPALVVAPTSLMANWQAEAARFAPGLRVLLVHGKERQDAFDRIGDADLVLTTYALLGRDEAALRRHRYHLLILDEAQYIKNSRAKAAQVACLLEARHRLCLTGTPVQNHLGELWSQFHFLMPGLLGEEKQFKARFRKPIEQQGDVLRKDLLARRLKPFMLRRTKDKVATELPPKTEIVLPVDFGAAQRDLYETVRVAMDKKVREEIDRKGAARSQIVILDALLKLRQVCCDPRLLKRDGEAGSAKLDTLLELLDTLLSEGRKVLVFSQFTSMLALIAEQLAARDVDFVTLTGDTQDRAAPVAAFQQGQAQVFLVSLKAGGVGLNLTAADTVIHYDPWWNPAAENQATDRAWRIGQEQPVFVYKLIARGTLEEKIQELQQRKGELANALLAPEGGLAAAIGPDDLQAMFAPL